ncbi:MAG TPA: DUF4105 domain-containing protein [Polyangiaceae bacterium]|nr:DUF4105 domain-containing protein [Polyangiaceae bacterium]
MTPAWAGPEGQVEDFVAKAQLAELSERVEWRRLLHYRRSFWGGLESEVDQGEFFLSSRGSDDPRAELEATVREWFSPADADPDRHPVCRFPARFGWLQQRLRLPPRDDLQCPAQRAFAQRLAQHRVSVFFAANSLKRPESALGHTLLMLDDDDPNTAGITVDYRVKAEDKTPILYSFKGLTGLVMGRFEIEPADTRLLDTLTKEHRDLWQLELDLTPQELERFVLHLWELRGTRIRYFYLTENCSYRVLSVLEAAAPRLRLLEHAKFVVIPLDTVRALYGEPGLVRRTRFYRADAAASSSAHGPRLPEPTPPPRLQALDQAHGPMRLGYGSGYSSDQKVYAELGFRLAYHDLLDPPIGAPELMQVQALHLKLRYAPEGRSLTVDEITFIDLMSVSPIDSVSPLAWRLRAFGDRLRDESCQSGDSCFVHGVDLRVGASVASDDRALALFVLPGTSVMFSGNIDGIDGSVVRWALGPSGGLRLRLGPRFVGLASGTFDYLPWQTVRTSYDARAEIRWGLARDVALSINGRLQPQAAESGLTSYVYF